MISPAELSPAECSAKASITVEDLQFETQDDGEQRACVAISVQAGEEPMQFDIKVPLRHQAGDVETALHEAQVRLVHVFDDVVEELTSAPLSRR